jgi:hypothetical protein
MHVAEMAPVLRLPAAPIAPYQDPVGAKLLELDLFAIGGWQIGKRGTNFIFPVLLIACKNLRCPLVFFTHREPRMQWFLGQVQVSGMPFEIKQRGETESMTCSPDRLSP